MSRTDKTDPHWVLAEWWKPRHSGCQHADYGRGRRACDLPAEPLRQHPRRTLGTTCYWWPGARDWAGRGAPTWFVRLEFTGPERRRVRDELIRARQEYRATGEVDVIPSTTQHRHMARWDWW